MNFPNRISFVKNICKSVLLSVLLSVYLVYNKKDTKYKNTIQRPIKSPLHQGKQILLSTVRP